MGRPERRERERKAAARTCHSIDAFFSPKKRKTGMYFKFITFQKVTGPTPNHLLWYQHTSDLHPGIAKAGGGADPIPPRIPTTSGNIHPSSRTPYINSVHSVGYKEGCKCWKKQTILKCVLEAVIYCGRQCIALRGDNEKLNESGNPGNFLSLLKLMANHNEIIRIHLEAPQMKCVYKQQY